METKTKKSKGRLAAVIGAAVAVIVAVVFLLTKCVGGEETPVGGENGMTADQLAELLAADGTATIELDSDVVVSGPLTVNGDKTLVGSGKLVLDTELEGQWPENEQPTWGMGCAALVSEDAALMPAMLKVSDGASLTVNGSVVLDAQGNGNGILVEKNGKVTVSETAVVQNGRYANLIVKEGATAQIEGGSLLDGKAYNVINYGTLTLSDGLVSGAEAGAVIYSTGSLTQTGGKVEGAKFHNVYVAGGTFTMTGGENDGASKDGVMVAEGATADITGGTISNCIHGLCNNGTVNAGEVTLNECGIMNYQTGVLNIKGTTVDTSAVYCLANNGGKVVAEDFTAMKCDTCTIYNFSGDMELINPTVTGSRDGNIANAGGNLTVTGGILDVCRDKSVVVGNGKVVLDGVTIAGTTGEKYGVYAFGGELYINDSAIENVSSTAVKVDLGSYVELNNVTIKDVQQNGFQSDGGEIVANNVTMDNMGSHGIYNNGGEITVNGATINVVEKNAVQHKSGTTVIDGVEASGMGNHGAYIEAGTLTVTNSSFTTMEANGFYLVEGDNKLVLDNVTISGTGQQGINNNSVVEANKITITDTGMNGIFNKEGAKITVTDLTVENVAEHGVNNKAEATLTNVTIKNTGADSNGIQNNGTMTVTNAYVENSKNHGLYNTGALTAEEITINGTTDNGVYNNGGNATINKLEISNAGTQGVNTDATIVLTDVKVNGAGSNGIYVSAGKATVTNLTVDGVNEHGVNNKAEMTLVNATIQNTGAGKNGIQNGGTMEMEKITIVNSKNHGIYNNSTLKAKDVTVSGTADNGVYNDGGVAEISGLMIGNTGGQGVNNNATITLTDVMISGTGKNGIYNSKGTATVTDLKVDGTTEHGINNAAEMTAVNVEIQNTGVDKNGVQNSGDLELDGCNIIASKNHGIYNSGNLSGSNVTVAGADDNGIYNDGGVIDALTELVISEVKNQGINNTGTLNVTSVLISGTGKNGVYNNGGTAVITKLEVTDPGEHGVSNKGTLTLNNAMLDGSAEGSNCIQNNGSMTVQDVTVKNSKNHGIYNDSEFISLGKLTVSHTAVNGIYNYGGNMTLAETTVSATGSHGINNAGELTGEIFIIDTTTDNGIQNNGTMTVTGSAVITNSGKHGMYNGKTFVGENITIQNAVDLLASNSGDMTVTGFDLSGSASKALYNSGYAELYTVTVDGTEVTHAYLVDNNGGVLDLTDATIQMANGTAIWNRGQSSTSVTNVIIDHVGNYGIFVEGGSRLSGDGLVINHVTMSAEGAEGIALKSQGEVSMMDHLTLGAYDEDVTGSGAELMDTTGDGLVSTALQIDGGSFSGSDLVIVNCPANAIYNKGVLFVKGLTVEESKNGLVCRYNGWATLSGTVVLTNIDQNPVRTFGKDDDKNGVTYQNGVTVASGADVTIDTAGSHAINNKGSFLAAADSMLTIKNISGKNINAINNNTGTMTLGNVNIDGLYVTVTMYNETTINSNSGNGIQTSGKLEINGEVTIQNIYIKAENNKTDNSNSSGLVVKNNGSVTGTGSITVIGSQTAPEGYEGYTGLFNGIFTTKCSIALGGDIYVSNAKNQGIYVADANASLSANNITVEGSAGNGIYVNNGSGQLTSTGTITITNSTGGHGLSTKGTVNAGDIVIDTTASGKQGMNLDGGSAKVNANNITIKNAGGNGIYINNTNGALTATGTISIDTTAQRGLANTKGGVVKAGSIVTANTTGDGITNGSGGEVYAGSISISSSKAAGITSSATIEVTGDVTIDGVTGGDGIKNTGKFTVGGTLTVKNVTAGAFNAITNTKNMNLNNVVIDNVRFNAGDVTEKVGNAIYSEGAITLNGTATISNIFTSAKGNSIGAGVTLTGGGTMNGSGSLVITGATEGEEAYPYTLYNGIFLDATTMELTGDITVTNAANQGIYVANENAKLSAGNVSVTNAVGNGVYVNKATGQLIATGTVTVDGAANHGISNSGTIEAANMVIKNVNNKNGLNNAGTVTITGTLTVTDITKGNADNGAVYNTKTLEAGAITISGVTSANGLYNKGGSVTVTGAIKVSNVAAQYGIRATGGTIKAGSIEVTDVKKNIGIFMESKAVVEAGTISVTEIPKGQAIQMNHANTFTADTLIVMNCGKNGLRIYNNSANPTVTIGNVVAVNCTEYGVAAQKKLTSDNLSIGTVWYQNCGKGAVHGNIKSGVGEVKNELPAASAAVASAAAVETAN